MLRRCRKAGSQKLPSEVQPLAKDNKADPQNMGGQYIGGFKSDRTRPVLC